MTAARWRAPATVAGALGLALLAGGCAEQLGLPSSNTEQGGTVGNVFDVYLIAAYVVGAVVLGLIAYVVIRNRAPRRPGPTSQRHHNTPLEITYTVVPLVIIAALTVLTLATIHRVASDEPDPDVVVDVEGYQWGWRFTYVGDDLVVDGSADGTTGGTSAGPPELVLPAPARIRFDVHSDDVIHSFWIPAFRFKRDLIPGAPTSFTVDTTELGTFDGKCAEYCGLLHTNMVFTVRTVSPDDFRTWLDQQRSPTP